MDNSYDRHNSETQAKTQSLGNLLQIWYAIKSRLVALFVLTEEEKIAAGIYIGRMGEDE
ncbi:MAG: hypothetical protein JW757_05885 [Anaerolineales bacterium]|nr:hypothetical protein [Anaerolineales bacterium]